MKALVTGGCGFIGYALSKKLVELGYSVDIIDNLIIGKEAKFPKGCVYFVRDVRSIDRFAIKKYKYIFHMAALSRIQPSFEEPIITSLVNATGTLKVAEYALRAGSKLIYAGSSSKHHDPEMSPYAMSKYVGEQWIKMYKKVYGLNAEIARFYNVYGPGELVYSDMAAVIGIFRKRYDRNQALIIHGDGEQRRDFTHIDDIVDGLIRIADSDEKHEDAWELGTGKNYSIKEVAQMFNTRIVHKPDVQGNYRETIRINNDAVERLGWKPTDKLKQYIDSLIRK